MSKVKFKLDLKGLDALMQSAEMQAILDQHGAAVAGRASAASGEEYAYRTHIASYVAITNVYPDSKSAAHDNYENNTLLKALGGGK